MPAVDFRFSVTFTPVSGSCGSYVDSCVMFTCELHMLSSFLSVMTRSRSKTNLHLPTACQVLHVLRTENITVPKLLF